MALFNVPGQYLPVCWVQYGEDARNERFASFVPVSFVLVQPSAQLVGSSSSTLPQIKQANEGSQQHQGKREQRAVEQQQTKIDKSGPPNRHQDAEEIRLERNALTNIGNQLLSFLNMRRKSRLLLHRMFPEVDFEKIEQFYKLAKKIKRSMRGYISYRKLTDLWHNPPGDEEAIHHEIIRRLCHYYLSQNLISAVLTSKKIKAKSRLLHFKIRRKLIALIEDN